MKDLSGRTAFITGGASGIGYAMAESFAGAGMKLALADKDADLLDQAVAELARSGAEVIGLKLDVTDRAAMLAAAAAVQAAFGAVHVLCNNAGIGAAALLEDTTPAEWDASIGINLTAIYNGLHAFLPGIRRHGQGGHIVNTASMSGLVPTPGMAAYTATKFAVVGLTETLHQELRPHGIGVTLLCPGFVKTRLMETSRREVGAAEAPPEPARAEIAARIAGAVRGGIAASAVGAMVLRAIQEDQLYCLTTAKYRDLIAGRLHALLAALEAAPVA
jgi:NAD(P)-dependent dehydrogenase (short-subunit alcohol dehydrogenase family)